MGLPMHEVPLPHWPLSVICRPPGAGPVGMGPWEVADVLLEVDEVVDGVVGVVEVEVVDVLVVVGVVEVEVLDVVELVDVVVATGTGRGHPHTPYCGWQSNRGAQ